MIEKYVFHRLRANSFVTAWPSCDNMSKAAGKQKGRKSKEITAKREDEACFNEDSAGRSQNPGHGKLPEATVPRGGEGPMETPQASGEADQVKKKPGRFQRLRKTFTKSKRPVQSPTSSTLPGGASRQSEETEETTEREGAIVSAVCANLPDSEKVKCLENALDGHIRLHADMTEEMRGKADEVEHKQNEIEVLRREMDARDEELRAQGEVIQELRECVREKEKEIEEKIQSMEDFHRKVEQRDRQLDYLKKPQNGAELSPKALEEYDLYFDRVLKLTEEVTHSEATVKQQQQELEKLRKLVERAKKMEEQVTHEKKQKIMELNKHVHKIEHTVGSGGVGMENEMNRFRPVDSALDDVKREASQWKETPSTESAELSKLRGEVGALRRENDDLKGEIEAQKAQASLWKEDFQKERHDREQAVARVNAERGQLHILNQRLQEKLRRCHIAIHHFESENKRLQEEIKQLFQAQQHENKTHPEQGDRQLQEQKARLEQTNQLQRAQLEVIQQQLRKVNQQFNQAISVSEKHEEQKAELSQKVAEKETLLQAARAEQLQLRQLTQEKDRFLQGLLSEKDQLSQQVSTLNEQIRRHPQQLQSRHSHQSDFWEVPRDEITLNTHKILGTGAWGFVVEGVFRSQKVAVKCLHDMIRHPEVMEIIRKEIGIMAQIRHPNLVLLVAAVIDAKNDPLIVTELLDISLRKAYENHRLQGSSKLSIFRDIASALNYLHLHQRGEIIHRDVSSGNVLLEAKPNNQWKAKLSDFGSAKLAIEAKTTGPGSPAYTAPEVQKEMATLQTAKLDVYSYGIVLCEVIVEQFPVDGSLPSMMHALRSRWPYMHGLVTYCIQEHPDNRPTMSYVLGEFDKL